MVYSKVHTCGLCGKNFASLPNTLHRGSNYHPKFCDECADLIEAHIRLIKRMTVRSKW